MAYTYRDCIFTSSFAREYDERFNLERTRLAEAAAKSR